MKRTLVAGLALMTGLWLGIASCKKDSTTAPGNNGGGTDDTGMVAMTPYNWQNPPYFPLVTIPADNEMYVERIALGKQLFFDTRLSNDGSDCQSCHKAPYGFSMDGVSAPDKGLTSLPLINLAWYKNFMWNSRIIGTLEDVMYAEITVRFKTDIAKINGIAEYKTQFRKYYGVSDITAKDMARAMAQYMRVMVSKDTRYEKNVLGYAQFTADEQAGRTIFFTEKGDCFHCHVAVLATDNMLHNNGLDSIYTKEIDKGYYNVTNNPKDLGLFRTPNLRNVALRTRYMHDGRFTSLEQVVDFYDHQVHRGIPNIDPVMLKPGKETGLHLTDLEKQQLIAFLRTLTDSVMISNPAFQ